MTVCGIKQADGVCVMGECPYIKMCCPVVWDKRKSEPMTEEEYIRSCSTEELANWLLGFAFNFCFTMNDEEDKKNAIKFLKEKHE